jgi:hypothetical protein
MTQTDLPQKIKWINAIVLITMTMFTIFAIAPWNAWKVDPASHGYGSNRFSYFTVQSNFVATATFRVELCLLIRMDRIVIVQLSPAGDNKDERHR